MSEDRVTRFRSGTEVKIFATTRLFAFKFRIKNFYIQFLVSPQILRIDTEK